MSAMDSDQLEAFVRIVRDGSFTRAAQTLDIPQPTISGRIRALEEVVGGELFHRSGRRLTLTERGNSFLPYAERGLELLNEGIERSRLTEAGHRGRVTVGAMISLAVTPLAPAVDVFLRTHPQVDLWIESGHSPQIIELIRDGVAQLGLITSPFLGADLEILARFRDPLIVVSGPDHPLAGRGPLPLKTIVHEANPFLWIHYSLEIEHLRTRIHNAPGAHEVDLPAATIRELMLHGTGAGFVTASTAREDIERGRLVVLPTTDTRQFTRESALVKLAQRELPAPATAFAETVWQEARRLGIAAEPATPPLRRAADARS
jgi:DNA-binding transcriptional LysR family regulator